jgi:anti-sigma regulatory factor (Ser/Thr protein kinase)
LREQLSTWGLDALEFSACQALTELSTNAVIHARTEFGVTVDWSDDVLKVGVQDGSPKLPVERAYGLDATTGRGLALVGQLCRSWGVERRGAGKVVWFEVVADAEPGAGLDDLDADALLAAFDDDIVAPGADASATLARVA